MFWVVVALLYFVLSAVAPSILGLFVNRARPDLDPRLERRDSASLAAK